MRTFVRSLFPFAGLLSLIGISSVAFADVAPPPDYEETCTVALQGSATRDCVSCAASYQEPDICATTHATDGYANVCRAWGGSFWDEVWCKDKPVDADVVATTSEERPATPPKEEEKGCSVAMNRPSFGAQSLLLGAMMLLGLLWVGRRRG
ncbi:MAG: hypothetical protein AUK47_20425 [Deltaproteobacteria bacterium CG2_30_63_29]|nr:MAG: hypothetical protein AUK47_20425 [Deltaproteobacteria bacterium CG2_30_63_29]PIW00528.1 MAG: hypothetical protein COW42_07520 [Deltaproteobacteria bacterium CG17_big_fil_post_rev_8_21_14_2_50_63_7]PJB35654.1 MAG: hypothetical protein CO108_25060 [Deltaproteobacteria bacterium CG_4_9_14_3_um_filter_63_12]